MKIPRRLVLESKKGIIGAATVMKRRYAGLTMLYSPRGPVFDYKNPKLIDLFCQEIDLLHGRGRKRRRHSPE